MPDLDKLKYHLDRLQSLLEDRHPGLHTWSILVAVHCQAIGDTWDGEPHDESWSEDWPTEPGYYWFYGLISSSMRITRLHFVEAREMPDWILFTSDGKCFWDTSGASGYWMPARVPEPPKEVTTQ